MSAAVLWLLAGFLAFTSVIVILTSHNLRSRVSFVYWKSRLRYIAALLLISAGIFGNLGLITVHLGLGNLAIDLVYMIGVPKELGLSHRDLLCDSID